MRASARKAFPIGIAVLFLAISAAYAQQLNRMVYSETANAHLDIRQALIDAKREHKRIILDFGGNWCGDCLVLDYYLHQEPNLSLLEKNFVMVHVNIGHYDKNTDLAEKYQIPLKKGVPALAVLDAHGKLLYSQKNKEFEKMANVAPSSVTAFLNEWKATKI